MIIAFPNVPAAITHVDARTGCGFTTAQTILNHSSHDSQLIVEPSVVH